MRATGYFFRGEFIRETEPHKASTFFYAALQHTF
jgi:hypothetical protein